ncbi:MAG: SH3 domain-containing protein [bacterium]
MSCKRVLWGLLGLATIFIFLACGDQSKQQTEQQTTPMIKPEVVAVCIWDGASLRSEPSRKAKLLSTISLGEQVIWLGDTVVDSTDKNREYYKIKLSDGKEGWTSSYLLVPKAKAAAITQKAFIYKRPDLLTVTDDFFEPMNMVAVVSEADDWLEVVGNKRKKKGWIKNRDISYKEADVAVTILTTKALAEKDAEKQREKITAIINNPDFAGSIFLPELREMLGPGESMHKETTDTSMTEEAVSVKN